MQRKRTAIQIVVPCIIGIIIIFVPIIVPGAVHCTRQRHVGLKKLHVPISFFSQPGSLEWTQSDF